MKKYILLCITAISMLLFSNVSFSQTLELGTLSSFGAFSGTDGESQLVNQCSDGVECSEEEHQLNRRSMFINRYNIEISDQDVVVEQTNMTSQEDAEMSTYTVIKGNTLYSIARRFNMSVDTLKGYNGLTSNNISVGQVLILHPNEK